MTSDDVRDSLCSFGSPWLRDQLAAGMVTTSEARELVTGSLWGWRDLLPYQPAFTVRTLTAAEMTGD